MPFDLEMPDGTIIQDVPDGTTKAQIMAKYQAHQKAPDRSWGDVAGSAIANIPQSAGNLVGNLYQAVRHPIDTASGLLDIGAGELQKLTPEPIRNAINSVTPENAKRANDAATATNEFYKNRYGSVAGFKDAVATDPVGVLADASLVVPGAGAANPLKLAGKVGGAAGRGAGLLTKEALGLTTGAGGKSIDLAYQAGKQGGPAQQALIDSMRGNTPIESVVDTAKTGLRNLEQQRGREYRANIGATTNNPTPLSVAPVYGDLNAARGINSFGGMDLAPSTAKVRDAITDAVDEWATNPNPDFRTAAGFDALKKRIGDIRDTTDYGTPERVLADKMYNSVKSSIVAQSPDYAKTMAGYAKASDQLDELRKTFSLKEGTMRDTSIRKLQSALRDNVNTSFGRREALAQQLANAGAPNLMEQLAGQTLSSPTSRGIGKLLMGGEAGGAAMAALMGNPLLAAKAIPVMMSQSPRLVGEGAVLAGRGARMARALRAQNPVTARQALLAEEAAQQQNNQYAPQNASALGAMLMGAR